MNDDKIKNWQESEDERLEFEGYCNKIRKGLEDLDERSGERALWELVQNARDMSDNAHIKIELMDDRLVFSHHGKPFDYTSFRALVKQDSSKDRNGMDQVGQYGTGFMTTHAFNRLVYVSGPFEVKQDRGTVVGYVQVENFKLDRNDVDSAEGPARMKEQLDEVRQMYKKQISPELTDDTTSFCYELDTTQVHDVSRQLSDAIRLMPFVLVINSRIGVVEINNHLKNEKFTIARTECKDRKPLNSEGWQVVTDEVSIANQLNQKVESFTCKSLQSDKGDVIIIPPKVSHPKL